MSRFVRPETKTIQISNGDWLLVKKRLSAGEQRATFSRLYTPSLDGDMRVNPIQVGLAQIVAYLLDWSLTDDEGKQVVIRDKSADDVTAILDNLDPESFAEIREAIEQHEEAMRDEREEQKKTRAGGNGSSTISPSLVDAGLTMPLSPISTQTSMPSSLKN